ncbi:MAG: NAD(P)/FAD-dependent oxidoreductase [Ignavibacteriaceae bacterium]
MAVPIRAVFSESRNIRVIMDDAVSINKEKSIVHLNDMDISFDYLIVATGSKHSYFGNDQWEKFAPGLKSLEDALKIRERILISLEEAEKINDEKEKQKYLTYVIIGGGPTGVELAGAIAEIIKLSPLKDFRNFDPSETKVYLIEGLPKLLSSYPDKLSEIAKEDLQSMGVNVILNKKVTNVAEDVVNIGDDFIETKNIIWAAGNLASPILKTLNTDLDRAGRVIVNEDLSIKGFPNIFVIGDAAAFKEDNHYLPGVAQVAMQQGRFAAKIIKKNIQFGERGKFKYKDKGNMATIGRAKAVAEIKGFKLSGLIAWIVWSFIHIMFLIGFRNRFRVMAEWIWHYITFKRGIKLIVGHLNTNKKSKNNYQTSI